MYKKALSLLLLGSFAWIAGFFCLREAELVSASAKPAGQICLKLEDFQEKEEVESSVSLGMGIADIAVSGQRVVDYHLLEETCLYNLEEEEIEILCRIVEAEAGGEDEEGKVLVANVVLNRLADGHFPETIREVVFQQTNGVTQFSPVANGSYARVSISEETVSAVGRALRGEDLSEGALYFAARKYADNQKMRWFDENLTFLFQHGGHEFCK